MSRYFNILLSVVETEFCVLCKQTVEHFAWNVRVLKGQADLLRHAQNTCCEDMKQVHLQPLNHFVVVVV